jgi:hypothetical protein
MVREGQFFFYFQINVNELVSGMADLHDNERHVGIISEVAVWKPRRCDQSQASG